MYAYAQSKGAELASMNVLSVCQGPEVVPCCKADPMSPMSLKKKEIRELK